MTVSEPAGQRVSARAKSRLSRVKLPSLQLLPRRSALWLDLPARSGNSGGADS